MSMINKFKQGLQRSKSGFIGRLDSLFGGGKLNEEFYEELEEILVSGDVGVQTTIKMVEQLKQRIEKERVKERKIAREILQQLLIELLEHDNALPAIETRPYVILLVGVNGSGKTTSAAKLAHYYKMQQNKVLLVAGDTFRAAAIEQLEIWGNRAGVEVIKQQSGSDPSALFFDAMNAAQAREYDLVIGDTAGRLHSKFNLMEELNKIYRVIGRNIPGAPHKVLLVVDATTGQNALAQARSFNESLPLDGIILTKLDGTARGGIVLCIQDELNIPVHFIGTGEAMDDLTPFNAKEFIEVLLEN